MAKTPSPVIQGVQPGSLAAAAGLRAGDILRQINGHPVHDLLDYRYHLAAEHLTLTVERPGTGLLEIEIEKDYGDELDVDFGEAATFDGVYTCKNKCVFCFVHQSPRGMRRSLYYMDDDFRLSFLHGNFITLAGIEPDRWQRIIEQRLSPLYISVHATEDDLRAALMGTDKARGIMAQLRELQKHGIQYHTQVVCCPGLNDGAHLEQTISDLISLGPDSLLSVSVVPVGLTRHRDRLYQLRNYTAAEATIMVNFVEGWQARLLPTWRHPVVWASDEWYVLSNRPVPPAELYGAYDQLENGVGMIRLFREELQAVTPRLPPALPRPRQVSVVTGVLAQGTLADALALLNGVGGLRAELVVVENQFYGPSVTCAGLLAGQDMISALRGRLLGDLVVLPAVALRDGDGRTLDDLTLSDISLALNGVQVVIAGTPTELADAATAGLLAPLRRRPGRRRLAFRHKGDAALRCSGANAGTEQG